MKKVLPQQFFTRPAPEVARELLGKYLVRRRNGKTRGYLITETESYDGFDDTTSHAARGKTKRNAPMFGAAGIFYVYFCYGMYWMLNVVTNISGVPSAVLIRGVKEERGERGINGPGRLTKALAIDKRFNKKRASRARGLWFEDRGFAAHSRAIKKTPRIGVGGTEEWKHKPLRFVLNVKSKNELLNC